MKLEQMDSFEKELQQALQRRPAPPGLKAKILHRRGLRTIERRHSLSLMWQRLAAGLALAAIVGGGAMTWRLQKAEERRKGEEARRQVMTALRITGHALKEMNARLTARDRGGDE